MIQPGSPDELSAADRTVVLFSTDLMLISSVSSSARVARCSFRAISMLADVSACDASTILCVDLNARNADVFAIAAAVPSLLARAIAFGPHVHTDRLQAARDAGFGKVLSRGGFVASLGELLVRPAN